MGKRGPWARCWRCHAYHFQPGPMTTTRQSLYGLSLSRRSFPTLRFGGFEDDHLERLFALPLDHHAPGNALDSITIAVRYYIGVDRHDSLDTLSLSSRNGLEEGKVQLTRSSSCIQGFSYLLAVFRA